MMSRKHEKTESSYFDACHQLPPFLRKLTYERRNRPLNVLQLLVLALHMRDAKADIRQAREAYLAAGGELPAEPAA